MNNQTQLTKFPLRWDRFVFISSLVGLLLLIAISLFRYYYLIPAQRQVPANAQQVRLLQEENEKLKNEIERLHKKIDNEN